ncbi:SusC/RagA family TonB-linked outer membrane protein [Flavobacterium faecale]|uniref:SusC/RagA family TonB-linked outer membrane protein n=1 Tax=Flavobacterium faecale TaxID=1355330 RepID=A0A2S1LEZ2_9FLAO|nr:TonB-dependent receptor [Flavobacterium faecale]AWG22231.1 SusC/RagA family TonB-linked outer membrane protein [Flavobacterium faecale]
MKFNLKTNWKLKSRLMAIMLLSSFGVLQAQKIQTVSGKVTGDGGPLPGVSVIIKDSKGKSAVTDFDGNYQIQAKDTDVLSFSYIGFMTQNAKVNGRTSINVNLKESLNELDNVVVVGYGTQRKKEVTGAVSRVKEEDVAKSATSDLGSALQGLIAGVNVTSSSGDPGAEANVQIRGLSSVLGSNRPLYVVDGIPYDANPNISMNEIETIDVLKDAASAAIYGTRGSAGVILITTKQPKVGIMKVKLDSYYGVQSNYRHMPVPTVEEKLYMEFINKNNQSGTVFGNSWTTIEANPTQLTNNSNFYNVIENDLAPIQSHNLSISGGKDGLSYTINGGYFGQQGSLINSNYERYNVRANTQFNKGNWKITTGLSARNEYTQYSPWGLILDAVKYNPYGNQVTADQTQIDNSNGDANETTRLSYIGAKLQTNDKSFRDYFDGNISAEYSFNKNLKYTVRGAVSYDNSSRFTINPSFIAYDNQGVLIPTQQSKIRNLSSRATKQTLEHILNYNKKFGNHNLGLTAVYSSEQYTYGEFYAEKFDIVDNDITVLNGANGLANAGSGNNQWTQNRMTKFIGTLGRAQYNYKGKYLLSVSARRDGSSKFNQQHFQWFPSASIGWNASDEEWWKPIKGIVSNFKARASRGSTGNSGVADYSYSAGIDLNNDYVLGTGADQNYIQGGIQTAFANKNVKWETSVSTNLGFDFGFLNNKLTLTSDFYVTQKKDMLFPVLLPPTAGGGSGSDVVLNVGDMKNTGIELAMNYRTGKKFKHDLGVNFTKNSNTVTKMSGTNKLLYFDGSTISGQDNDQDKVSALAEGYVAGAFFLMKTDGVVQSSEELIEYQKLDPTAKLGDLRYVDSDGDGKITNDDRRFAGSGTPDFEIGLNYSANFKNFDFSMQWYGSFGAEIINGGKALGYKSSNNKDLIYQWTAQNPTSQVPADRGALHNNYRGWSDYWLEDGTFVRLRNVSLGYTVPNNVVNKLSLTKLRFFVSAQNPLRITKYKGYDPEVGNNGLSTRGIDKGTVPQSSKVTAGLQLEF